MRAQIVAIAVLAVTTSCWSPRGRESAASWTLLAASITEQPPFDPHRIGDRRVTLSFVLDRAPVCGPTARRSSFAFLIGSVRIAIRCDPQAGRFTSETGPVQIQPLSFSPGEYALSVTTTVSALPAPEFSWVAVAEDGGRSSRIPAEGANAWRVFERWAVTRE